MTKPICQWNYYTICYYYYVRLILQTIFFCLWSFICHISCRHCWTCKIIIVLSYHDGICRYIVIWNFNFKMFKLHFNAKWQCDGNWHWTMCCQCEHNCDAIKLVLIELITTKMNNGFEPKNWRKQHCSIYHIITFFSSLAFLYDFCSRNISLHRTASFVHSGVWKLPEENEEKQHALVSKDINLCCHRFGLFGASMCWCKLMRSIQYILLPENCLKWNGYSNRQRECTSFNAHIKYNISWCN